MILGGKIVKATTGWNNVMPYLCKRIKAAREREITGNFFGSILWKINRFWQAINPFIHFVNHEKQ